MAEHPNVQRARDAYTALAVGDLAVGLRDLAPGAVLHLKGLGPLSGDRHGVEDITAALLGLVEFTGGTLQLDVTSVYADDDHAVVMLRETARRADGATLDVDEAHVLALNQAGQITDLWDLPSDPDAHERFFDGR